METKWSRWGIRSIRWAATLILFLGAGVAVLLIWTSYITAPWTRDGRVRVQVASIAPQVSGQIVELHVSDNQFVHKGDILYVIDRFDFQAAYDSAKTQVQMRAADFQVKRVQAERRETLTNLAASVEEKQQYAGNATQAEAAFKSAQIQLSQAEVNLKRTEVRSTVNGYITNLLLRVGDYATTGNASISVIDTDSYWVDGYFEETKMSHICVGDLAEAKLMGYPSPIVGRVQSITRGISVPDAAPSTQGLPNVDPVYTWVRLAQRVPVRLQITNVPKGVPLVAGMTATVSIHKANADPDTLATRLNTAWTSLGDLFDAPDILPACSEPPAGEADRVARVPEPKAQTAVPAEKVNPGLTPDMNVPPWSP